MRPFVAPTLVQQQRDDQCAVGSIPKRDGKLIDDMWLYTALAMIGENFEAGDELCGAVIRFGISSARKS